MKKSLIATAAVGVGIGLAGMSYAGPKWAKKGTKLEKCAGVAKKERTTVELMDIPVRVWLKLITIQMSGYMFQRVSAVKLVEKLRKR